MGKIKIVDTQIPTVQDDSTLKPMEPKVNAEYRPEVPINEKITANDHDIFIYNIKDVDKRNTQTNNDLQVALSQVKLINDAINALYENVKWTKIYSEAFPLNRLDKQILNAAGTFPQYLNGWYIDENAYEILTSGQYRYWLWIWYDENNNINYSVASAYLNEIVNYTLASAGSTRTTKLSWNKNALIKTTETHSTNPNLDHLASNWSNGPRDILLAKIDETDNPNISEDARGNLFVFSPFFYNNFDASRPNWTLEGIYGRIDDVIPLGNNTRFVFELLNNQFETNPDSPFRNTWNSPIEQDDPEILRLNENGAAGEDFEILLSLGDNSVPWISFYNEPSNDSYYVRIANTFHGANFIEITTSKPEWNFSNKPSIFYREMFLEGLNYFLKLDSHADFLHEYETLIFSLFSNLAVKTTIFDNPQYLNYRPDFIMFAIN